MNAWANQTDLKSGARSNRESCKPTRTSSYGLRTSELSPVASCFDMNSKLILFGVVVMYFQSVYQKGPISKLFRFFEWVCTSFLKVYVWGLSEFLLSVGPNIWRESFSRDFGANTWYWSVLGSSAKIFWGLVSKEIGVAYSNVRQLMGWQYITW